MTEPREKVVEHGAGQVSGLSALSKQVLAVWFLACIGLPVAILVLEPVRDALHIGVVVAATVAWVVGGVIYAQRRAAGWWLIQGCMVAVVGLGGYWGNRWLFVGVTALLIYLYFSLYTAEVRREFQIHVAPREVGVLLVLLGMCALLAIQVPSFLEGGNLLDVARQFSMVGIMAVGMTMVIILGGIDLSVGSIVALSGCLATLAMKEYAWGLPLGLAVALASGALVGLVNGALVSVFRMAPFVITLGTMSMARSLAIVITDAQYVQMEGTPAYGAFTALAREYTAGVPNLVWIMLLVVLVGHVFLSYTRTGRHVYYIGANEDAARLSGLNVAGIKWGIYTVCGLLAGLAGLLQASRVTNGQPNVGVGDELKVIAAVIIGGASFSGGVGTVLGALIGAAIMGVLTQGLILLEVSTNWQQFVQGVVIIGAVALDMLRRRK